MRSVFLLLFLAVSVQAFDLKVSNHTTNNIVIWDRVVMAGHQIVITDFGSHWTELEYVAPGCGPVSLPVTNRCHVVITVCEPQVLEWWSEWDWFSKGWMLGVPIFGFFWVLRIVANISRVAPEGV